VKAIGNPQARIDDFDGEEFVFEAGRLDGETVGACRKFVEMEVPVGAEMVS